MNHYNSSNKIKLPPQLSISSSCCHIAAFPCKAKFLKRWISYLFSCTISTPSCVIIKITPIFSPYSAMEILLVKISTDTQGCECTSCHGTEHLRVVKNGKFPVMFILPQYQSAFLKKKTRSTLTSTLLN